MSGYYANIKKKEKKMDKIFDFGFTAVTEEELDSVSKLNQDLAGTDEQLEICQAKLDQLYNTVIPLLNNLKKNPEKDYIHWPDRLKKVEAFEELITKIYNP